MVEITEVLRLWQAGVPKKRIAARLGLNPKTVRRYVAVAEGIGLRKASDCASEARLRARRSSASSLAAATRRLLGQRVVKKRAAVGEQLLGLFALEPTGED